MEVLIKNILEPIPVIFIKFVMSQKLLNTRQKASGVVIHTSELYNAVVSNFWHNHLGLLLILSYNFRKFFTDMNNYLLEFTLFYNKINSAANL